MFQFLRVCRLLGALFLLSAVLRGTAAAQEEANPILRGEVRMGQELLTSGTVVLHQVSAESSGEVDSTQVTPTGSFQIRLPHVPDHRTRPEVFFASVEFGGLHYFGPAITEAVQLDSLYLIEVYDTVSVPEGGARDLPVSMRNLFLEKAQEGWDATDLIQLRNDGNKTLYSPTEDVIWAYPLPAGASDFQLGQADMAPDALRFLDGRMELYSPIAPGEMFLLVRYHLPTNDFVLPLPGHTEQMEVFVREPGPPAEFPPLTPSTPAELDPGTVYRRYVGENLVETEVTSLVAPEPWSLPAEWLGILLAGLLGGAGVFAYRRRPARDPVTEPRAPRRRSRDELLLAIAELDEAFQGSGDATDAEREAYQSRRASLLAELKRRG